MNSLFVTLWLAALACLAAGEEKQINEAFDKVLQEAVQIHGKDIDPYQVKDRRVSFDKTLLWVRWSGSATLHNIVLDGLADIHRTGDAVFEVTETGRYMSVLIKIPVLFYHSNGHFNFLGIITSVNFYGQLDESTIWATIKYDPATNASSLVDFKLDDMKKLRIRVDGFPLLTDTFMNVIIKSLTSVLRGITRSVVQKVLRKAVQGVISESVIFRHIMTSLA